MRLLDVQATAHPAGNRIDVSWALPADTPSTRVRVVRGEGTYPLTRDPDVAGEGVVVPEIPGETRVTDRGVRGGTTYYYSLFPQGGEPERVSALATSPQGTAEEMYELLPAIYRRYDSAAARRELPLRRFLDLPGGQLDQLYSQADAMLRFLEVEHVDGALLPLLAEWIGWRTNHGLELADQRTEIRHAPEIYRTIGLIPVIEATVQRMGGMRSRVKEFVDNVALTNRPERLNLWSATRRGATWGSPALLSLDGAYRGRPAAVQLDDQALSLFYEKEEDSRTRIWCKSLRVGGWSASEPFTSLDARRHSAPTGAGLGTDVMVFWVAFDERRRTSSIWSRRRTGTSWAEARLFVPPESDDGTQRRLPAAVGDGTGLWLFYLQRAAPLWRLRYNRHNGQRWQISSSPAVPVPANAAPPVVHDLTAVFNDRDAAQRLWLLWAQEDPLPDQDPTLPQQTRWTVYYRVKKSADPAVANDWGEIRKLAKPAGDTEHEREPFAVVGADGNLEVYTSAFRGGRWRIWRRVLNRATHVATAPEAVPFVAAAARAPVAFAHAADTVLVARSSESLRYRSGVFGATETVDRRFAGTAIYHVRDAEAKARRGTFDDAGTYVYDTGRARGDWYARDTVGIYVEDADDSQLDRLDAVLHEFMPATDRAVFIKDA